jgi:hypothetical protein
MKRLPKRFHWTETERQYALASLLLVLLPLLAALQYRWLGQLGESERKQMQTGLRAAAARFGEDFDREVTIAYAAFLPDVATLEAFAADRLAQGYARWQATARYPLLVKAIYQADAGDDRQLRLSRFDPATRQMISSEWPAEMIEMRERMKEQFDRLREFTNQAAVAPRRPTCAVIHFCSKRIRPRC